MRIFWRIISGIIAFILCIVALGGLLSATALNSVEHMFTRKGMVQMMEKADMNALLQELLSSDGENLLTQVAGSEPVKEIVVDYLAGYGEYLIKGTGSYTITDEQKDALLDAVIDALLGESGVVDESTANLLRMQTKTTLEGMLTQYIPPYNELDLGLSDEALQGLRVLFSPVVRGIAWGLVVVSMLLIMLIRFSWHEWMAWGGFAGLTGGIAMLGGQLMLGFAIQSAATDNAMANSVMTAFFGEFQGYILIHGLWITGISVLLIILFFVIRALIHRHNTDRSARASA